MSPEISWNPSTPLRATSYQSETSSSSSTSLVSLAYDPVPSRSHTQNGASPYVLPSIYNCLPGLHTSRRRSAPCATYISPSSAAEHGDPVILDSVRLPRDVPHVANTRENAFSCHEKVDSRRRHGTPSRHENWHTSTRFYFSRIPDSHAKDRIRPMSSSPCAPTLDFFGHTCVDAVSRLYTNSVRAELHDLSLLSHAFFPLRTDQNTRLFAQWWSHFACFVNSIFDVMDRHIVAECLKCFKRSNRCESSAASASFEAVTVPRILAEIEISRDLLADINSKLNRLENCSDSLRENNMHELVVLSFEDALRNTVMHLDTLLAVIDCELTSVFLASPPDCHMLYWLHLECANTIIMQASFKSYRSWVGIVILLRWIRDRKLVDVYIKTYMKGRRRFYLRRAERWTERHHFAIVALAKGGRRNAFRGSVHQ